MAIKQSSCTSYSFAAGSKVSIDKLDRQLPDFAELKKQLKTG